MFIRGTTEDFSDARPVYGMFVSPDGEEWSSRPYTEEQRIDHKNHKIYWDIMNFHKNQLTFEEIYETIKLKQSKLSKKQRDFVINYIKNKL